MKQPEVSPPSDKAVEAVADKIALKGPKMLARPASLLRAAHDPALGLERSVCLRDVVEALQEAPRDKASGSAWATYLMKKFAGS